MSAHEKDRSDVFRAFVDKAQKRLVEKRTVKYQTLYVPSLDEHIKVRSMEYSEFIECSGLEDNGDPFRSDKYAAYLSVVEPDLTAAAKELKESGSITEYMDVTDIFELTEVQSIAEAVLKLSGFVGSKKVMVVEELKN